MFQVDYTDFVDAGSMLASELKRKGKIPPASAATTIYERILSETMQVSKKICGAVVH